MKNKPSVMVLLLLVLSLYILANPGSMLLFQTYSEKSSSSSSDHNSVPPLRQNDIPPTTEELSPNLTPPQTITSSIINQPALITPGTELHIRTQFIIPGSVDYVILSQEINLYLYTEADLNTKFNGTHLENLDPPHLINTTAGGQPVTNATDGSQIPALNNTAHEGWINCTIELPSMTDLQNNYNITHGDNVTILQYFPGGSQNATAKIEGVDPFWYMDNFTLTGVANIDSQGITNPQSGDSTFRQGGNASAILNATSEGSGLENVTIFECELHFSSNDSVIANGSKGFYFSLHDMSGNRNTTTDTNGNLRLIVNTTTSVKEDEYYFLINASFAGTTEFTQNYETGNPSSNYDTLTANFTIENEMDTVYLDFIGVTNQPLTPPDFNITLVTYRARTVYNYTGDTYYPANIPVNVTFANFPSAGVSFTIANGFSNNGSAFWGLTNSNGYIVFNITAEFPILYSYVYQDIQAVADFQSNSLPLYPPTTLPNNQPHMFMQNLTGGSTVRDSYGISIDPDFWVGEIFNTFVNFTSIAPGESAYLEFEVRSSNDTSDKFFGVPVNFTLDEPIDGVSLEFAAGFSPYNSSHYLTNGSGIIGIYIHSTYLVTPETFARINLTIRIDFWHDSQVRWIGTERAGTSSLAEFNQTWLFDEYTIVTVGGTGFYIPYEIVLWATNETGDTIIRSGDALELTYKVQPLGGGIGLAGVPVDFILESINYSISLVYVAGTSTDGSGLITVRLITTYGVTPNNHDIHINATADFQNDTHPNVWYVGEKAYDPDFRTNTSYSDVKSIITVDPQYFIGDIHLNPDPFNPNATSISQTYSINISFRLKLNDTLGNINGVPISITINNSLPSTFNITVLPAESQNTSNGIVSFIIKTNSSTPQADYTITATAHFGDVKSYTYNVTHPTVPSGKLLGIWVNGSINNVNSTFTQDFRVKNVDVIQVQIASINDNSHPDEGFNATTNKYEIYRGTTYLNISGSYKDQFQTPLTSEVVRISFNYTGGPVDLANPVTNIDGTFWVNVSISSAIPLEDITIYGWDPDLPNPREYRLSSCNIRLMSTINLIDFTLSGYTGNAIFVGETITGLGSLRDDNTNLITTSLTNLIRISGWNGTHDVGTAVLSNYNGVSYSLNYVIPLDYLLNDINITLSVIWGAQLQHYRPTSIQQSIFVYRGFSITSLEIYLPFNTSTIGITNNSINTIYQFDHKSMTIQGVLEDLNGDILDSKQIRHYWNTTFQTEFVLADGSFSESYPFTGYDNTTFEWRFYHILDNGTTLSTVFFITFIWEVYDETAPQITISSPVGMNTTGILSPNAITRIDVIVIDPDNTMGPGYISVGLDNSSVNITIDGVSYIMTQYSGIYMFYYDWDTSSPADMLYRINITAKDNAGNPAISINYDVGIDFTAPSATIDVTLVNTYLDVTPNGWAVISGTFDISGQTYTNSSFDTSNSNFTIQYNNGTPVYMLTFDDANISGYDYSFHWDIYNSSDHSRFSVFDTSEDWRIVIDIVDMAGNTNQTVKTIKLDNSNPTITATGVLNRNIYPTALGRDPTIHSELLINVTFDDVGGIGVDSSTLYFELFDNTTGSPISKGSMNSSDPRVTIIGNSATLTFNLTSLNDNSYYFIRAVIYDQTSNIGQVLTRTIAIIYPAQPTSTTTTTTTNGGPNGGNPFSGAFLFNLVLLNLLALGGGVGIAVLYERFKTMKG